MTKKLSSGVTYRPLRLENTFEEGRGHAQYGAVSMNFLAIELKNDIRVQRVVENPASGS
jgi:hypothetical protein